MKIIKKDNFSRDHINDEVIAENVSEYYAKVLTDYLNLRFSGEAAQSYFVAESDDYKPYKFEP